MSVAGEAHPSRCPKPSCKLSISLPDDSDPSAPPSLSTHHQPRHPNPPGCYRPDLNSPKTRVLIQFADRKARPRPPLEPKTCIARASHRYVFSTKSNERVLANGKGKKPTVASVVSSASPLSQPRSHLHQIFLELNYIRHLPPVDPDQLRSRMVLLSRPPSSQPRKTLIFDLDETLVHCVADITRAEVLIPVRFSGGETVKAGVNVRPFARECLQEASKVFEVMVFTASHQCYADRVLDHLDPTGQLIHHRLYRDSCLPSQGLYIKDLRVLANRRLQDVVLVDNAVYSFAYQLDNGVPIVSWFEDQEDRELLHLMKYLEVLATAEDVRQANRSTFHLQSFCENYRKEFGEDKENAAI